MGNYFASEEGLIVDAIISGKIDFIDKCVTRCSKMNTLAEKKASLRELEAYGLTLLSTLQHRETVSKMIELITNGAPDVKDLTKSEAQQIQALLVQVDNKYAINKTFFSQPFSQQIINKFYYQVTKDDNETLEFDSKLYQEFRIACTVNYLSGVSKKILTKRENIIRIFTLSPFR